VGFDNVAFSNARTGVVRVQLEKVARQKAHVIIGSIKQTCEKVSDQRTSRSRWRCLDDVELGRLLFSFDGSGVEHVSRQSSTLLSVDHKSSRQTSGCWKDSNSANDHHNCFFVRDCHRGRLYQGTERIHVYQGTERIHVYSDTDCDTMPGTVKSRSVTMNDEQRTMNNELWTMNNEQWTMNNERWTMTID